MKKLFVETYGCQMNVRDAEEVTGLLLDRGFTLTPEQDTADVILYNTCSVREQAEHKVWSNMGSLKKLKSRRPELIIGLMGCMAKAQRETIFSRMPHVDFISGPAQLYEVPELIDAILEERRPMKAIQEKRRKEFQTISYHAGKTSALVTIMEGCDKVCSYCIIPYTRGPEVSRPPEQIIEEVRRLVDQGYKEVMLLGQNVNSYGTKTVRSSTLRSFDRLRMSGAQGERSSATFADLLAQVNAIPGIERIRFITSHPWDAVESLFEGMRDLEHVCEHLHLPVQSGSDQILEKMRRGYTAQSYLEKLALLRRHVPEVSVTTDVIIGFPGETEEDFEATIRLMEQARFDSAFIFNYSPRPFAAASRWEDDVPQEVKDRRLQRLLKLQEGISQEKERAWVGRTAEVMVEEPGMGRTRTNLKSYFEAEGTQPGQLVQMKVEGTRGHSLLGRIMGGLLAMTFLATAAWATEELSAVQGAFLQGDYKGVISKTEKMIPHSSASQRDQLFYLQGVSALKLRNVSLAKSSLEHLLKEFPRSPFAAQGGVLLNSLSQPAISASQPEEPLFTVQVGAFSTGANAVRLQKGLQRKGYDAFVSESAGAEDALYRVRVGRFTDRQEAEKTCERLRADGFPAQVKP